MNTDCAWCGTGEGLCDEHLAALLAQSAEIAASGKHLAGNGDQTQESKEEQPQPAK